MCRGGGFSFSCFISLLPLQSYAQGGEDSSEEGGCLKNVTDRLKGQYTLSHGTNFSAGGVIFFSPGRDVNTSSAESDSPL